MIFSLAGFRRGFRMCIPIALAVFAYGLVFGMLAQEVGMTSTQSLFMSLTVFAGASQLIAMELWTDPLPVAVVILTTFVVNARHLLMGAAVQPYFRYLTPWQAYGGLFFCADENWALSMRQFRKGERDAAFLAGAGFAIYVFWAAATMIGYAGGAFIENPATFGLDFAFTAVFVALLISMWHGRKDLIPWVVAAAVALITEQFVPGKWYILSGALAGSGVAAWRQS